VLALPFPPPNRDHIHFSRWMEGVFISVHAFRNWMPSSKILSVPAFSADTRHVKFPRQISVVDHGVWVRVCDVWSKCSFKNQDKHFFTSKPFIFCGKPFHNALWLHPFRFLALMEVRNQATSALSHFQFSSFISYMQSRSVFYQSHGGFQARCVIAVMMWRCNVSEY
jgi:hypothetical protein